MSNADDNRNGIGRIVRSAAAILFVLIVGMGSTVSPQVEGAVDFPVVAEDAAVSERALQPSECAVDGLVFADCNLEF